MNKRIKTNGKIQVVSRMKSEEPKSQPTRVEAPKQCKPMESFFRIGGKIPSQYTKELTAK